jgi:hypothetical protein
MSKGVLLALFMSLAPFVYSQHEHHGAAPPSQPAALLEGLGDHTHPIATASKEAQQFFDQGMALIFGFNHDEAARQFARAAQLVNLRPWAMWTAGGEPAEDTLEILRVWKASSGGTRAIPAPITITFTPSKHPGTPKC